MISFIIPAHNEEQMIAETIQSIRDFGSVYEYEVIVSNNKSTDKTKNIALANNAIVVDSSDSTISGVRNTAVKESKGDFLVFLDADVRLTMEWRDNITKAIDVLRANPMQITGSRCAPPQNGLWLNKYWFELMLSNSTNYINSGHLITSRALFEKIGGFDERLKTAEDYDFCQRALTAGALISPNEKLVAIHDGYPRNIQDFIKRERWHGREDFSNFKSIRESKVALLTIFHVFTLCITIALCIFTQKPELILIYFTLSIMTSMLVSIIKFPFTSAQNFLNSSAIAYLYFWGRSLALFDRLSGKHSRRIREQN